MLLSGNVCGFGLYTCVCVCKRACVCVVNVHIAVPFHSEQVEYNNMASLCSSCWKERIKHILSALHHEFRTIYMIYTTVVRWCNVLDAICNISKSKSLSTKMLKVNNGHKEGRNVPCSLLMYGMTMQKTQCLPKLKDFLTCLLRCCCCYTPKWWQFV